MERNADMRRFITFTLVGLILTGATTTAANTWRVEQGDVRVICPMTIGGSFDARTQALEGLISARSDALPVLDGSLVVDLRTLDTGIGLRNQHLRENYLEVGNGPGFDRATLSQLRVVGFQPDAPEGKRSFTGLLTLHGVTQAVSGTVDFQPTRTGLRVRASFPLVLADYGIRKPRYLGIGVKDAVQIEVVFAASR